MDEPSGFSVERRTTGVPKYRMLGSIAVRGAAVSVVMVLRGAAFMVRSLGARHFGRCRSVAGPGAGAESLRLIAPGAEVTMAGLRAK
ncbi:hypothetical protein GCM10018966_097980 [Streptomyces yanii]